MSRTRPLSLALVFSCVLAACERGAHPAAESESPAAPAAGQSTDDRAGELTRAAERVVAFLRGSADFDAVVTADTVTLLLSPEGGGTRVRLARDDLRQHDSWRIRAASAATTYSLVPPPGAAVLTTRVGTHFNCYEYPLASRYPELAGLPHVGVKLQPPGAASCLQAWNATLVFEAAEGEPVLQAVVYDQWEW